MASSWPGPGVCPEEGRGGAERTSHFVVSFPAGTDPEAAERAGRAWAEALLDSGAYGDRWDYYTAFHTNTDYPHMHVVVSRRGLDDGIWLKVSRRSAITFETLREVQVEVAAREGIALIATPRLARGIHERPVPDAEYRRAREEGRAPVAPEHSTASAVLTAAQIVAFARQYASSAAMAREAFPELAARMEEAAATLMQGLQLASGLEAAEAVMNPQEISIMSETIEEKREAVVANFVALDADVREVEDPVQRMGFLREIAQLKAEAAPLLRDHAELQAYRQDPPQGRYTSPAVESSDPASRAIKAEADRKLAGLAREYGLEPEAAVARYAHPSVSAGLARDYHAEELQRARREPSRAGASCRAARRGGGGADAIPRSGAGALSRGRGADRRTNPLARLGAPHLGSGRATGARWARGRGAESISRRRTSRRRARALR